MHTTDPPTGDRQKQQIPHLGLPDKKKPAKDGIVRSSSFLQYKSLSPLPKPQWEGFQCCREWSSLKTPFAVRLKLQEKNVSEPQNFLRCTFSTAPFSKFLCLAGCRVVRLFEQMQKKDCHEANSCHFFGLKLHPRRTWLASHCCNSRLANFLLAWKTMVDNA